MEHSDPAPVMDLTLDGELLEGAGFAEVEGRRTGAPLDAVLAIRKE
jgi:hypothetical protein